MLWPSRWTCTADRHVGDPRRAPAWRSRSTGQLDSAGVPSEQYPPTRLARPARSIAGRRTSGWRSVTSDNGRAERRPARSACGLGGPDRRRGPVVIGDGHPPILAEGLGARSGPRAASGGACTRPGRPVRPPGPTAAGSNPAATRSSARAVALDVAGHHRVEHGVGRQRLVVALVGPQLGRRGLGQHRRRGSGSKPARALR